jgi:hypothetical protein
MTLLSLLIDQLLKKVPGQPENIETSRGTK